MTVTTLPGQTIGIIGTGQLGRMMTLAAKPLGYKVVAYGPDEQSPCHGLCDEVIVADYSNKDALQRFAESVDVVTLEFENIPLETVLFLEKCKPVFPNPTTLFFFQHRAREKEYIQSLAIPVTPYAKVHNTQTLQEAILLLGTPGVLKLATQGYDGKGQIKINTPDEALLAYTTLVSGTAILEPDLIYEAWIAMKHELSVIGVRSANGEMATYPVVENHHTQHILDWSVAPARVHPEMLDAVQAASQILIEATEVVGTVCVEWFVDEAGNIMVNEVAPRPHNSGHWTLDNAITSQFENHIRAICGLSLGSTQLKQPACAMTNLLGDLWLTSKTGPEWQAVLAKHHELKLHLYGKEEARRGRKMGHLSLSGDALDPLLETLLAVRNSLA
jgi:5-(carboxyamino)imidazole ribonucleotide synthase